MSIKENKKEKSTKLENKICEKLGYESSLFRERRFKPFCG